MVQVKSYQGFFRKGQFMSPQAVTLPENVEVFITITGRTIPFNEHDNVLTPEQAAVKAVLSSLPKKGEYTNEDEEAFARLERGEYKPIFQERLL